MIRKVHIENLKSIDEMNLECRNINLLIGTNSSGKTTVLQGLLLLLQNNANFVGFNDAYVQLGEYDDARCRYIQTGDGIVISIEDTDNNVLEHKYKRSEELSKFVLEKKIQGEALDKLFDSRTKHVQYLSCHRVGPLPVYKKNMTVGDDIGIEGEYAIAYLNSHANDQIAEHMCKAKNNLTLLGQVNWWLKYITDAVIRTEPVVGTDYVKAAYQMNDVSDIRPINIGAGISYIISVLIMCLASEENSVLIIENPEIHLHPLAQARVCEFLYFIANNNRQIFVETHSDHIFNGFRVGIAQNKMDVDKINIAFTYIDNMLTKYMKVDVGEHGRINNQRRDLFDQFDIDMRKMIGLER